MSNEILPGELSDLRLAPETKMSEQKTGLAHLWKHKHWVFLSILLALWTAFAAHFIFRTSHVSIDGVRYFMTFDDGMISMRYAKNLVEHHQLVWNLGDRVEGITNPLWTVPMAIAILVFGTHWAPLVMQMFGGLVSVAIFLFFFYSARRNGAAAGATTLGFFFLIFTYPLSYWGLVGMEACATALLSVIAMSAQYAYEKGLRGNPLFLDAVLISIAYLLRPDGWLAIAPFFAACLYDRVKSTEYRKAVTAVLIPLTIALSLLLAQKIYYGDWLPNTYVLKVQGYSLSLRLKNGMTYLTCFSQQNLGVLGLILLAGFSRKRIAYLSLFSADLVLTYQVYVGGDAWQYWRQLLPVYLAAAFAILVIFEHIDTLGQERMGQGQIPQRFGSWMWTALAMLPVAAYELCARMRHDVIDLTERRPLLAAYFVAGILMLVALGRIRTGRTLFVLTRAVFTIIVAYSVFTCDVAFQWDFGRDKPYPFFQQAVMVDKAVLANRLFGSGKTHHVIFAGTYPYMVEGKMIDGLGKSDKVIARYPVDEAIAWNGLLGVPGHAKYNFRESILDRKPDIVAERASWGLQDVSPEMKDTYRLVESQDVALCVQKNLTLGMESLVVGTCPGEFFTPR